MNKLTVLVDMDDTLENLCETWVEYLNERHGTNVHIDDVKEWDMTKAFPTLSKTELFAPLYEEELWKRVKPLPGSVEYVKRLLDDGHKVIVVTASHQDTVAYKLNNVLFRYFPFLTTNDVVVAYQKQLIRGDVLIDDAPHNLIGGEYKGILMNAPHNKQFDAKAAGFVKESSRYYVCSRKYVAMDCDGIGAVSAEKVEDIVFFEMREKLKEFGELQLHEKPESTLQLTKLKVRADQIEKEIDTLVEKIPTASKATMGYINKKIDELDEEHSRLKKEIADMSADIYGKKDVGVIKNYLNNWESISISDKITVVDALIESVRVNQDTVDIVWKI